MTTNNITWILPADDQNDSVYVFGLMLRKAI